MGSRYLDGLVWGGGFGTGLAVISVVLHAIFHVGICG